MSFRAPSWGETRSGLKSSSGKISYLVFQEDNINIFDYEGSTWWNSDWSYRKKITIQSSQVSSDITQFPILLDITDSDLADNTQDDGEDILFTDFNGIKLNHEI